MKHPILDRLRRTLPPALVRHLPAGRRTAQFLMRLEAGDLSSMAGVVGLPDPFGEPTALFRAVDHQLTGDRADRLGDLTDLARYAPGYAAQVWRALVLWQDGAHDQALAALDRLSRDDRLTPFYRTGAAAWAVWLRLPGLYAHTCPLLKIMQFWDRDPLADVMAEIKRWRQAADHHFFDDNSAAGYIREHFGEVDERLFRQAPHAAIRSDVFRLCWLARDGGLYVDADARRLSGFSAVAGSLAGQTLLWFRTRSAAVSLANTILAAPLGAPLIVEALERAWRNLASGEAMHVFDYAGPSLLTRTLIDLHECGKLGPVAAVTDGWVAGNVAVQIDASYKGDARNWHLWQASRP